MKWIYKILLLLAMGLIVYGALNGGAKFVWSRASALCLSCMGLQ